MLDYSLFLEALRKGSIERRTDSVSGRTSIWQEGRLITGDDGHYDIQETIVPEPVFVMFGAGHVGKALYDIARLSRIRCIILDDRPEVLTAERFPEAERWTGSFEELLAREYHEVPCYIIFTHGHKSDLECLLYAIRRNSLYIGMIGSEKKVRHQKYALRAMGIEESLIESIHSPIGLSINAVTPEEIAISIMAEIISVLRADKKAVRISAELLRAMASENGIEVRIIRKEGSSPQDVGAEMFVTESRVYGTIGGGKLEALAIGKARRMLSLPEKTEIAEYSLEEGSGMLCGGAITLLFARISREL